MPAQVLLTDFIHDSLEPEREVLDALAEVRALDAKSEAELIGQIDQADALMVFHHVRITAEVIERLQRCRVIARCGVGYDNLDLAAAGAKRIPIVNIPDYGTEEVADSAIGLMLALTRGLLPAHLRLYDDPNPWTYHPEAPLYRLRGKTFGIIGLGRIGTATAVRAKAFGMQVGFYDPLQPDGLDKALGIRRFETLRELLNQSFVLSVHCPLNAGTNQLIGTEEIAAMPPGSFLINTARGGIVDTDAVAVALASGQLAGAGLDVLPQEPPAEDDLLMKAWRDPNHLAHRRLMITPHSAFYCEEGLREMRVKAATVCRHAIEGRPLRNIVNHVQPWWAE